MAKEGIAERVAALADLSRSELIGLWVKRYGVEPPMGIRQPMLLRAAAAQIQERQLGGYSPNCKRLLKSAVKRVEARSRNAGIDVERTSALGLSAGGSISPANPRERSASARAMPLPGARLIREWNGRRYVVEVTESGFVMDGKIYKSLTAIAVRITGAKWSGPRFFGL
jgi:hypothetical protein